LGLAHFRFQTGFGNLRFISPEALTKSVFTPTYARFRELLIEAREKSDLTQSDLAERLGRPQSYVSKFERGERRLDIVEFIEVARALRVDPIRLFKYLITGEKR
jgi:hypothetical protein